MKLTSSKSAILVLCLLVSFLPACGSSRNQQTPATTFPLNGDTLIKMELIFGFSMPNGEIVSQDQWQTFVDAFSTKILKGVFLFYINALV
ncbi:hypothetical protein GWN42_04180 [candidate division KSB1 bacterium]|nr:hypothetical protein [candidate division KSB1 bacterium]